NDCPSVQQTLSTIENLRTNYTSKGVMFWMVDANAQDNRSNILAEAIALKINVPIMHDDAQIVARDLGVTTTPEDVCLNVADWTIFYRGAIDDRIDANSTATTQNYLVSALENFLANQPVSPIQTLPKGCPIDFKPKQSASYSTDIAPLLQSKCARCHS